MYLYVLIERILYKILGIYAKMGGGIIYISMYGINHISRGILWIIFSKNKRKHE